VPPKAGILEMNFDEGRIGDSCWNWGMAIRNHIGDVVMVGVKQNPSFASLKLEEVRACLFGIKCAIHMGIKNLVVATAYL